MKLYERLADRGFHTTVFTTFGIDFDAYENIALSRLRGSGCHNNILVADQGMLAHALSGASAMPQSAGKLYSVSGARAVGVFHTKIILQLGRRQGRLIIGSANATSSGLAGNLELAGIVECDHEKNGAQSLIAASWQYLSRLLNRKHHALAQQLLWMETRTPWLLSAVSAKDTVILTDGTQAAFFGTDRDTGIMDRFIELVAGEVIKQLIVISPYWDENLSALKELSARLKPAAIHILIDKDRALFPGSALSGLSGVRVFDLGSFATSRFVHAKLIVARTADSDHVLFGSANCTIAALGRQNFAGSNEEACLYRRLPAGVVTEELGLDAVMKEAFIVDYSDLPAFQKGDDLPFDELTRRHPGNFECLFDTLVWRPPSSLSPTEATVELLKADESLLSCSLRRLSKSSDKEISFQINGASSRPALARLIFSDGTVSTPAIVSIVDALRSEVREARARDAERAANQLAEETEEGLWLLEALDVLEEAENEVTESMSRSAELKAGNDTEAIEYKKLNYEQFVAGRHLRSEGSVVGRNSLAGSELSSVRAFLNRVLALEAVGEAAEASEEESQVSKVFDLGDEVADAQNAIEYGEDFDDGVDKGRTKQPDEKLEQEARMRAAQRRANRDQIVKAVRGFNERIRARALDSGLTTLDFLRLRAVLTVVTAAGWSGGELQSTKSKMHSLTSLQVLPIAGSEDCWPRLLGQTVFALFGGKDPAIRHLRIEVIYDQIPDDLIECWGCCYWVVQACLAATKMEPMLSELSRSLISLRERVYKLTGLTEEELLGEQITQVIELMDERFAARLGIDSESRLDAHREYVRTLSL